MGQAINLSEIIGYAIRIEEVGYQYYVEAMKKVQEPEILRLFQYLADEEFKHEHIFRELLKKNETSTPPGSYPEEVDRNLKDFLVGTLNREFKIHQDEINAIQNISDAMKIALDFERNSIVFYTAVKQYMGKENHQVMDTIIQEELNHILKINQYREDPRIG